MYVSGVDINHDDHKERYRQYDEHRRITGAPAKVLKAVASLGALVL
jgi:hypothetical protein